MSYQQVHAGKVKLNGIGGIRRHLSERQHVKTNKDIDLSRSHLNFCIDDLTPDKLETRVHERIKQLNLKKKPRSDAVGLEDIIVGATVDFMFNLDPQTRKQYFTDALHFIQHRYGKENVMYCQCHMDESNPHIHIGVIPVTPDGRLSAKNLFCPKTLEQLQTDFHAAVASKYGLERGEHNKQNYLELNKFKARQYKLEAEKFANIIDSAKLEYAKIERADKSAHYPSTGVIFTSEDREHIQLPTNQYLYLKQAAEEGIRAAVRIHSLQNDIQHLKRDNYLYKSDAQYYSRELDKLEKATKPYAAVPISWRKNIDVEIESLQKLFTKYCHDVNRMTAKVFIATNEDFDKTEELMRFYLKNAGVKDFHSHIKNVVLAARKQVKQHSKPDLPLPSWKPVKPSNTEYQIPDQTGLVDVKLVDLSGNDINWDMFNWDLLSELDKDELEHKRMLRSI